MGDPVDGARLREIIKRTLVRADGQHATGEFCSSCFTQPDASEVLRSVPALLDEREALREAAIEGHRALCGCSSFTLGVCGAPESIRAVMIRDRIARDRAALARTGEK